MNRTVPLLVILGALLTGCQDRSIDIEAEEAALAAVDDAGLAAAERGDVVGHLASYAQDAVVLPPDEPIVVGIEAIRREWEEAFAAPGFSATWKAERTEVARSGDLAYRVGSYQITWNDERGGTVLERGKYVSVWKKQADGTWKIVADIFNRDAPQAPASKTAEE